MNQNKAKLIQGKIDSISTSLNAMIASIMAEKDMLKTKSVKVLDTHSIINVIPSYYNAINVIKNDISELHKDAGEIITLDTSSEEKVLL